MKIAIVGNAGSGKSTLALKLHTILHIPLYHLDQYFWGPGWQEPDRDAFEKTHNELCDKDEWIIEGMSIRFFQYRIEKADIVIFLDSPTYLCLYYIFKRAFIYFGKAHFARAKGCFERFPSWQFLKFTWGFNKYRKPHIEALLDFYKNDKKIFVIKSWAEAETLVEKFKNNCV